MAGVYLDTSALGRVLLAEPDAPLIRQSIARHDGWWSSELLVVELRRLGAREALSDAAEALLSAVRLVPVDGRSLRRASRIAPQVVRSLDAVHLEAAVHLHDRSEIDTVLTYDRQLRAGCTHHGLAVEAPLAA